MTTRVIPDSVGGYTSGWSPTPSNLDLDEDPTGTPDGNYTSFTLSSSGIAQISLGFEPINGTPDKLKLRFNAKAVSGVVGCNSLTVTDNQGNIIYSGNPAIALTSSDASYEVDLSPFGSAWGYSNVQANIQFVDTSGGSVVRFNSIDLIIEDQELLVKNGFQILLANWPN